MTLTEFLLSLWIIGFVATSIIREKAGKSTILIALAWPLLATYFARVFIYSILKVVVLIAFRKRDQ